MAAFGVGLGLFCANALLLFYVARRWFNSLNGGAGAARPSTLTIMALLVKVVFLGGGAYLALVVLDMDPIPFVLGLCAGLVLLALATLFKPARRRIFYYPPGRN